MITIDGRFFARLVMGIAGCVFVYAGLSAYRSDRYTPDEVVISAVAFVAAVVAAFLLRRWNREHGGRRS